MANHLNNFIASLPPDTESYLYKGLENQHQEEPAETQGEYPLFTAWTKNASIIYDLKASQEKSESAFARHGKRGL